MLIKQIEVQNLNSLIPTQALSRSENLALLVSVVLILFGVITFVTSFQYSGKAEMSDDPGPSFLPMLCSGAITILAIVFLFTCILNKAPTYTKKEERESEVVENKHDLYRLLITVAFCFSMSSLLHGWAS